MTQVFADEYRCAGLVLPALRESAPAASAHGGRLTRDGQNSLRWVPLRFPLLNGTDEDEEEEQYDEEEEDYDESYDDDDDDDGEDFDDDEEDDDDEGS